MADSKRELAVEEQLGHDAQKMLELLSDFDGQYTQAIYSHIMTCDPKDFESWRNLLKAKDAFVSYLSDKVTDGELAHDRMLEMSDDEANELLEKYEEKLFG